MKKNQSKRRNTITEVKNKLEWINNRVGNTGKYASDVEDGKMETAQTELKKEILKNENTLKGVLWKEQAYQHSH